MHYTGTVGIVEVVQLQLPSGKVFDSSRTRGKPFQFVIGIGQVIKGWDEGVMTMSLGERAKLTLTPDYGYGPRGVPGVQCLFSLRKLQDSTECHSYLRRGIDENQLKKIEQVIIGCKTTDSDTIHIKSSDTLKIQNILQSEQ